MGVLLSFSAESEKAEQTRPYFEIRQGIQNLVDQYINLTHLFLPLMIKEEDIFEEEEENINRFEGKNLFYITDDLRNNINKRLPRGFSLLKMVDIPKDHIFQGEIEYNPKKRQIRVASEELAKQFVIPTQLPAPGRKEMRGEQKSLRCGQLPQGKSKQGQKIKGIIQRFRRHPRYAAFSQYLGRMGLANAMMEIQAQNRKNIHTIESFKDRSLFLFNQALKVTYDHDKVALLNEMIDELQFLVENAQKAEFANSLMLVQKSIDKVTREISEIRQTGSYYYRRKKRNQKNYDEKELLYIAELLKVLPHWELVGVLEIIEDKPFSEISNNTIQFDLNILKSRKIREIEFYVKKKLCNYYRSRDRKHLKMEAKRKAELQIKQSAKDESQREGEVSEIQERNKQAEPLLAGQLLNDHDAKNQNEIDYIFEIEDVEDPRRIERSSSISNLDNISSSNRNQSESSYSQLPQDDLFMGESEQSIHARSMSDHSELRQSHLEFEQPNLMLQTNKNQGQGYSSSDSSYITDEEDSDF